MLGITHRGSFRKLPMRKREAGDVAGGKQHRFKTLVRVHTGLECSVDLTQQRLWCTIHAGLLEEGRSRN